MKCVIRYMNLQSKDLYCVSLRKLHNVVIAPIIEKSRLQIRVQVRNMSQNAFAKAVGLSCSTISDWKTKKTNPTAENIIPICEVLGVTPEQLLTGKGIDEDYVESKSKKAHNGLEITKMDIRIIEDFHGLQEAQRKRLLKYMDALKQLEELEEDNERKHRSDDHR